MYPSGYERSPHHVYPYVFCLRCRRAYPEMRDLEAEFELPAEEITCPWCGNDLPPAIGLTEQERG